MKSWAVQTLPELNEQQFKNWQKLVEDKTGMLLPNHRKSFLQSSLGIRMREIACESYDDYFAKLDAGVSATVEWAVLVDRLTVHETHFFRHVESYDLVRSYLKRLIINRSKQKKSINIWSVGCSTGEEPYSIGLMIEELVLLLGLELYYGITATDISLPSLATAREGVYSEARLHGLSDLQRNLYFDSESNEKYRVKASVKEKICFARVNLLDLEVSPIDRVDVVFCQNVLIYFQQQRKYEIVKNLANSLEPGGLMVLGLGDITDWLPENLRRVKAPGVLAFTRKIQKI